MMQNHLSKANGELSRAAAAWIVKPVRVGVGLGGLLENQLFIRKSLY